MRRPVVLFDLDGTLADSAAAIMSTLAYAFDVHGLPALAPSQARALVGPPFYESLPPLVGEDMLWPVIRTYRDRYSTALLDTPLFDGASELLKGLAVDGVRLAVASSKPETQVRAILDNLGQTSLFDVIGGDTDDGSLGTKALVVGDVLRRLGRPDPADVVMVGDRSHDVLGARAHGIDAIGVTWGYAEPGELANVDPLAVVESMDELADMLG